MELQQQALQLLAHQLDQLSQLERVRYALDGLAEAEISHLNLTDIDCDYLAALPRALRTRILRAAIYACGAPEGTITADHVAATEALVTSWHGQGPLSLPGGVKVERISGRLSLLAQPTQP